MQGKLHWQTIKADYDGYALAHSAELLGVTRRSGLTVEGTAKETPAGGPIWAPLINVTPLLTMNGGVLRNV